MKGEINSNTLIVGDFNTPLTPMDRSTKRKISKEAQALNDTMGQLELIDIYRTAAAAAKLLQLCPTLCDPIDGSLPDSPVPGILQARTLEWVREFHPKTINFTFLSSAHETFTRIDHILGHKSSLGKFKKLEIISSIFSDHNVVRLDVNYREKKNY